MRTWEDITKEYKNNDYTYEVNYNEESNTFTLEIKDEKGNKCKLNFKDGIHTSFVAYQFRDILGKGVFEEVNSIKNTSTEVYDYVRKNY